jgi:hypothetical protein
VDVQVVVCVEDPRHRQMVTAVIRELNGTVMVETDRPFDAAEVAMRFRADVVIVDLQTFASSGMVALAELDLPGRPYQLVALSDEPADFKGRRSVSGCRRFDPEGLSEVLTRPQAPPNQDRRRRQARSLPARDPTITYDQTGLFFELLNDAIDGDVLVVVSVRDPSLLDILGKVARAVTRDQDFVICQTHEIAIFVPGGGVDCPTLERIAHAWARPEPVIGMSRMLGEGISSAEVFLHATRRVREA